MIRNFFNFKKNEYQILGKKKKRLSLCKKAVYRYRFQKKQFLISNIFNFENKKEEKEDGNGNENGISLEMNNILGTEANKTVNNSQDIMPNISVNISDGANLGTNNQGNVEVNCKSQSELEKQLDLEKKKIKMLLNPKSKNKILKEKRESKEDTLINQNKIIFEETEKLNLHKTEQTIENNKPENSLNVLLNKADSNIQKKIKSDMQNISSINNNAFNYYNFNKTVIDKNDNYYRGGNFHYKGYDNSNDYLYSNQFNSRFYNNKFSNYIPPFDNQSINNFYNYPGQCHQQSLPNNDLNASKSHYGYFNPFHHNINYLNHQSYYNNNFRFNPIGQYRQHSTYNKFSNVENNNYDGNYEAKNSYSDSCKNTYEIKNTSSNFMFENSKYSSSFNQKTGKNTFKDNVSKSKSKNKKSKKISCLNNKGKIIIFKNANFFQ